MHRLNDLPTLPGFEIIRELGRGTSGIVYLARCQRMTRLVAVKVLLQSSREERSRFECELQRWACATMPTLFGSMRAVSPTNNRTMFGSLWTAQRLSITWRFTRPSSKQARIMADLAEAVEHVHGKRIIHRNLSPANVLLTKEGLPKLIGFHRIKAVFEAGE